MKATFAVAAAAAMAGGVSASTIHNRHAHEGFHAQLEKKAYAAAPIDNSTCGCTTIYSTYYGEATLHNPPPASTSSAASSSSVAPSSTKPLTTAAPTTSSTPIVVPTPVAQTCPTPGVYTFPATTVTLTETTTVCAASTTSVPAGTHTLGGVTTIVETATTVTCPYATVSTSGSVTTSVIETTTYVCPSAGTYTIAPTTTTVTAPTTVVVPVVSTYCPGTYTQPEVVTTIVDTSTVIYCPFDVPATTTAAATTSAAVPVYTTASVVPTTVASSTSTGSSSTATGLTGNGVAPWAITYTPYDSDGSCKSSSAVAEDIAAIAAFGVTAVRVYSTDCDTLPNVGGACADHGLKMILGIYIDAAQCTSNNPTVDEQISSIKEWAQWDLVDLIVVANEAIFNGYCTASELADLINECKSEFSGYTGPYTTTDTVGIWQESTTTDALCDVVDIVGAQAHAYFNSETAAADAGTFVRGQLDIVNAVCPGKEARVLETGWPSAGTCNGVACAGVVEQAAAIASLLLEVSQESVFFSLTDDKWKDGNTDCQCEQHWGCSSALGLTGLSL
ncbi:hypothetical protein PFICI_01443 [Pestalotiopsis fici W106-1]|uniref:Probable beta-glucosidase btgE n=1 Tax=Pestalotiopsis fici (strain W106-1 / CGMCC3.15140) TaxID=1229662 RepID=W3XNT1_PESFW|nr:uncharacterized protein PFICI_01443 [Pestalotiopsis fici W106-1]ETS87615.1 hypothetical protein PFICI_01443 [Pestalotiopsis fici W106-1]